MILEEILLAKRLIRKLKKANNDLVELEEVIGIFDFPSNLKDTVVNLKKEDFNLISKTYKASIDYLENFIIENQDKILMNTEDLLERFKPLEILIQELISLKDLNTDNKTIMPIYRFFGSASELTRLVKSYNRRLSLIESPTDKETIKDVMLKAIIDFKTNNTNLNKNSIGNMKEQLIDLSTNRSTIGDIALIKISKDLEELISNREEIEKWLSDKNLEDQKTEG